MSPFKGVELIDFGRTKRRFRPISNEDDGQYERRIERFITTEATDKNALGTILQG